MWPCCCEVTASSFLEILQQQESALCCSFSVATAAIQLQLLIQEILQQHESTACVNFNVAVTAMKFQLLIQEILQERESVVLKIQCCHCCYAVTTSNARDITATWVSVVLKLQCCHCCYEVTTSNTRDITKREPECAKCQSFYVTANCCIIAASIAKDIEATWVGTSECCHQCC